MEKPRSIDTLGLQELEEALQPLAVALLESAQWRQLNKTKEMTAKDVQELASAQAARAEQLVPFLQGYGDDADNKPQLASEQLADRESALYRDALAASYIQELRDRGVKPSDDELIANGVPLSGELPQSEQRRLLLPIEYALQVAEHENRENGTLAPVVGIGRAAVRRGSRREVGVTSSSDKSAWPEAVAA